MRLEPNLLLLRRLARRPASGDPQLLADIESRPQRALGILLGNFSPEEKRGAILRLKFSFSYSLRNKPLFSEPDFMGTTSPFFELLKKQPEKTVAKVHSVWQEVRPEKDPAPIEQFLGSAEGQGYRRSGLLRFELMSGLIVHLEEYYNAGNHGPGQPYDLKFFCIGCEINDLTFYY